MSAAPYWCTVAHEKVPSGTLVLDWVLGFRKAWLLMPLKLDIATATAAACGKCTRGEFLVMW